MLPASALLLTWEDDGLEADDEVGKVPLIASPDSMKCHFGHGWEETDE